MRFWRPTRLLTGLAAAGLLVGAQQADSANGVPTPRPRPGERRPSCCRRQETRARSSKQASEARRAVRTGLDRIDLRHRPRRRQGSLRDWRAMASPRRPPRSRARSAIRSRANWSNGRSCAATTAQQQQQQQHRFLPLRRLHQREPELAEHRTAAAPRRGDALAGAARSGDGARVISARRGRSPPRAGLRSPARCCCRATAPAHKASCARPGATTTSRPSSKARRSTSSATCITTADHKARMDMRLYAEDTEDGLRAANRAGGNALAIAKARVAVIKKAGNAKALLDAVPADARRDIGLHLQPRPVAATRRQDCRGRRSSILSVPHDHGQTIDTDQWWIERRLIVRKLLDVGDAKTAYRIAREAACAEQGELSRREPVHRRLDRAALPQRSGNRARAFRQDRPGHRQSDRARAFRLLAGPRRRSARPQG